MILAAGRGERLRPLTDYCPKPLVEANGKGLIEYHIEKLAAAGFKDIVINVAWLGDLIMDFLGNGKRFGVKITYSNEGASALETAGGISKALSKLGKQPFLLVNADVWTDFDFSTLPKNIGDKDAHIVMVNNPEHNPNGDFLFPELTEEQLTYSGIGIYHPKMFAGINGKKASLGPLLRQSIKKDRITAQHFQANWFDIGTPARLNSLELFLHQQ